MSTATVTNDRPSQAEDTKKWCPICQKWKNSIIKLDDKTRRLLYCPVCGALLRDTDDSVHLAD